jgi:WhiB family transcriptional regulator, redox-sensing transcriptional regulator
VLDRLRIFIDAEVPEWWTLAACKPKQDRGVNPAFFFPEDGQERQAADAAHFCRTFCRPDVRSACLEYAIATNERFGIWGGMTERQRRAVRRQRRGVAWAEQFPDIEPLSQGVLPLGGLEHEPTGRTVRRSRRRAIIRTAA